MDNEKFGNFIVKLRKEKNMTQQDVANKFNVTNKAVSKWERGQSFPDISMLKPLSEFFNVSILELLNGERNQEKEIDIDTRIITILKQIEHEKNIKIRKVIIVSTIIVLFIFALYIGIGVSKAELKTYNPVRAVIGYIRVSKFNDEFVEVGNIPTKTIYANSNFNIEEYMNKLGYKKIEGLSIKSGDDFYTNGGVKVLVSRYSRKGINIYEWEKESPYNHEKDEPLKLPNINENTVNSNIQNPIIYIQDSSNIINETN